MKKRLLTAILFTLTLVGIGITLPSCDDDNGPGYFYDTALLGDWQLYQINGAIVGGTQVNYLSFRNRGNGYYYYYERGYPYRERISYWCALGYNTDTITITYADGQTSTMNYWLSDNGTALWMSWNTYQGTYTYMYRLTYNLPY